MSGVHSPAGAPLAETVASSLAVGTPLARESPEVPSGTLIGEYRVTGPLGRGGMGEVLAAVHPVIGKRVAIKVIRSDRADRHGAVARFVQEARSVNQIGHPNIVDIFGFGALPDGRPYFVMEHLGGETLRERIDRGPLLLEEIAHVCDAICAALGAAHGAGIVHRDLKPENVFLAATPGGLPHVKLLDFGLAKLVDQSDRQGDRHVEHTETGMMLGTPRYLAPEQAAAEGVGPPTDAYALGTMIFEMVAGQTPFRGSPIELVAHQLASAPPRLRDVVPGAPRALDDLVAGLLAKEPSARPGLAEVRAAVRRAADRAATEGEPVMEAAPRRPWWRAAILAAAAAAVGAALWVAIGDGGATEPSPERPVAPAPTPARAAATAPLRAPPAVADPAGSGSGADPARSGSGADPAGSGSGADPAAAARTRLVGPEGPSPAGADRAASAGAARSAAAGAGAAAGPTRPAAAPSGPRAAPPAARPAPMRRESGTPRASPGAATATDPGAEGDALIDPYSDGDHTP
jgi:serine/threonine-protein kinase